MLNRRAMLKAALAGVAAAALDPRKALGEGRLELLVAGHRIEGVTVQLWDPEVAAEILLRDWRLRRALELAESSMATAKRVRDALAADDVDGAWVATVKGAIEASAIASRHVHESVHGSVPGGARYELRGVHKISPEGR